MLGFGLPRIRGLGHYTWIIGPLTKASTVQDHNNSSEGYCTTALLGVGAVVFIVSRQATRSSAVRPAPHNLQQRTPTGFM